LTQRAEVHDGRVAPFGQDLLVGELFGDGLDGLTPYAVLVLVDEAGRVFGRDARDQGPAQRVDQPGLIRGAGMDANPRPEIACCQCRVRGRAAKCDTLVVEPVDRDVAKKKVVDGAPVVGSDRYLPRYPPPPPP
jgi:hypothetical protein